MTRHQEPGSYRNLIGLKVSDDMLALIEIARGVMPVQDFLRAMVSSAVERPAEWVDWEQRAREAERKLELVREALGVAWKKEDEQRVINSHGQQLVRR